MYNRRLEQRISRQYPGLFVILLDQSGSMSEPVEEIDYQFIKTFNPQDTGNQNKTQYTKADVATAAINTILFKMTQEVGMDQFSSYLKKSAYISVIGYNSAITPLVSNASNSYDPVDVRTLDSNPKGTIRVERFYRVPEGMKRDVSNRPYWIKAEANGQTQMALALEQAKKVAMKWLKAAPEFIDEFEKYQSPRNQCFPPVIINITDARPTRGDDFVDIARNIQRTGSLTPDEEILIFTCHFSGQKGKSIAFPGSEKELEARLSGKELDLAKRMFDVSSKIPAPLRNEADQIANKPTTADTRCYVYNADPKVLIEFLQWGTFGGRRMGSESRGV